MTDILLEKDVVQLLLKRHIPVIIVLARKMYKNLPTEIQSATIVFGALDEHSSLNALSQAFVNKIKK